ncbi:hypothetical protein OE88DRAFT_1653689 [Heliocybe sulcata]|uniref:Uncharacterized protein n=1 Tax=Heliocybe sulcata TaxID=5364 RepID=A0A5C3NG93_9AGAM|nr:hypothetical protein OE88DRAFT_1653689 [Heliocybe sulcata]
MQSLAHRFPRSLCHTRRLLHVTSPSRDLIGPPDQVSNIRPMYYEDPLPVPLPHHNYKPTPGRWHPYSLEEFTDPDIENAEQSIQDLELQYKLLRQQLDAFNHAFWTDSNTRFDAAKATILESLPPSSKAQDRDIALAHFYQQWLNQESTRQQRYTAEFRRRSWDGIVLAARIEYANFKARFPST